MLKNIILSIRRRIKEPSLNLIYKFLMSTSKNFKGRRLFGAEELKLLHRALLNQDLFGVEGKMVTSLEQEFARTYGVSYAVASTSGTAAIHTALGAININPGDEVITAPITDLGTILPIINQGAIPVFADIDESYNMDPKEVEKKITSRTKAIIVVHLFGNPCDMDAMVAVARKHKVALIEDCCQSHVTEYKGKYVGTIGDIGCFSFQQSKHMTTGDGGMTITNNKDYYDTMKLFVDKGFARKGWGPRAYKFHGQNYRMNELTAAVGIAQLGKVKNVVKTRNELGEYFTKLLKGVPGIRTPQATNGSVHSYWLYPLYFVDADSMEKVGAAMKKAWIAGSVGYTVKPIYLCAESLTQKKTYGNSQYPFTWKDVEKQYEYKEGLCPKAEETLKHLYCISMHECWTRSDVEKAASIIRENCSLEDNNSSQPIAEAAPGRLKTEKTQTKATSKTRVAIIGCGQMGKWHLDAYRNNPDVEIAAYVDTDINRAKEFTRHVQAKAYNTHIDLIKNEKVDAVSLCTVPCTHHDIVINLLEAGIHVLCEKPLAISVLQAEEMIKKAEEKNRLILPAFKFRFFDSVTKAKEILLKKQLGDILQFRLMFGGQINMAGTWYVNKEVSGGGIIMDNGPHAFDLIRHLLGEFSQVHATIANFQDISLEDTAQLNCRLKSGAQGSINMSWTVPTPSDNFLEIYGTDGTMLLGFKGISYKLKTWADWKQLQNQYDDVAAFKYQIDHFLASVKGKQPTTVCNKDGLEAQRIIENTYESLKLSDEVLSQVV